MKFAALAWSNLTDNRIRGMGIKRRKRKLSLFSKKTGSFTGSA